MEIVYVLEKCWIYPASGFDLEVWEIVSISQDIQILMGNHEWTRPFVEEGAFPLLRKGGFGLGVTLWRISRHKVRK